ncbi:MAG: L,D-transpeptidase family protein, partial [Verrucomicrobia bacterium]|nr:L,D-transpeptidase family protein [Verrucomicrobiota bacterium]
MRFSTLIRFGLLAVIVSSASGQLFHIGPKPRQPNATPPPMRKATTLIQRQAPLKVNQSLLKQATQDNTRIVVSIPKQRAYLMIGDQVVADGPVSSGRRGHETPRGHFNVMEKDPNHHSTLYGDFVDSSGRTVRAGVSARSDSAPSGTHFAGAPMKWFLRLTGEGVGMHIGILPGYPASHGCIRESV